MTTQPSQTGRMVQALGLEGAERASEVGAGYGDQTALLARLAGFVTSIERWRDLAAQARANLVAAGLENVRVVDGDGTEGVPEDAPYDAVLVSAAYPGVPAPLVEQLRRGGRLAAASIARPNARVRSTSQADLIEIGPEISRGRKASGSGGDEIRAAPRTLRPHR